MPPPIASISSDDLDSVVSESVYTPPASNEHASPKFNARGINRNANFKDHSDNKHKWGTVKTLKDSHQVQPESAICPHLESSPLQKTGRSVKQLYETNFMSLNQEEKARLLLPLLQRKDPEAAKAEVKGEQTGKRRSVTTSPVRSSAQVKNKATLSGGLEEKQPKSKWSTVKVKNTGQGFNTANTNDAFRYMGDTGTQFSTLDNTSDCLLLGSARTWIDNHVPELTTYEAVQHQIRKQQNKPQVPNAPLLKLPPGFRRTPEIVSHRDVGLTSIPSKGVPKSGDICTCDGWGYCSVCVAGRWEQPQEKDTCGGTWGGHGECSDRTGMVFDIPTVLAPPHSIVDSTSAKGLRQGINQIHVDSPGLKKRIVLHDVSEPANKRKDSRHITSTQDQEYHTAAALHMPRDSKGKVVVEPGFSAFDSSLAPDAVNEFLEITEYQFNRNEAVEILRMCGTNIGAAIAMYRNSQGAAHLRKMLTVWLFPSAVGDDNTTSRGRAQGDDEASERVVCRGCSLGCDSCCPIHVENLDIDDDKDSINRNSGCVGHYGTDQANQCISSSAYFQSKTGCGVEDPILDTDTAVLECRRCGDVFSAKSAERCVSCGDASGVHTYQTANGAASQWDHDPQTEVDEPVAESVLAESELQAKTPVASTEMTVREAFAILGLDSPGFVDYDTIYGSLTMCLSDCTHGSPELAAKLAQAYTIICKHLDRNDSWQPRHAWTDDLDRKLMNLKSEKPNDPWITIEEELGLPAHECKERFRLIRPDDWRPNPVKKNKAGEHGQKNKNVKAKIAATHAVTPEENCWGNAANTENDSGWGTGDGFGDGVGGDRTGGSSTENFVTENIGDTYWNSSANHEAEACGPAPDCWGDAAAEEPVVARWDTGDPAAALPKFPSPTTYNVTYWATVDSDGKSIHIPIDSNNVFGPEKSIVDGGMKKVFKWIQEKGLGDKFGLQDAFELVKDMHNDGTNMVADHSMFGLHTVRAPSIRSRARSCRSPTPEPHVRTRIVSPRPSLDVDLQRWGGEM